MSFTITERKEGRRPVDGENPSNEIPYLLVADGPEPEGEEAAKAALRAFAPDTFDGLKLRSVRTDETLVPGFMYLGTASYGSASEPGQQEVGDSVYTFDTSGGTFHITQSKDSTKYPSTAPDLKSVIGATSEGDPEGVDITIPQFSFSETHYFDDEDVDDTLKGIIYGLTGKTNNGTFRGMAANEVLFLGASGSQRGKGDWEITFNFAASPNITGLMINGIGPIAKKGWEYLDVQYELNAAGAGEDKKIKGLPKHVYVHRVYDEGNFGLMGI